MVYLNHNSYQYLELGQLCHVFCKLVQELELEPSLITVTRGGEIFFFGVDDTSITNQQQKSSHIYTCHYMYEYILLKSYECFQ